MKPIEKEIMEIMKKISEKYKESDISFTVAIIDNKNEEWIFMGNACPCCVQEALEGWIEANNIEHAPLEKIDRKVH